MVLGEHAPAMDRGSVTPALTIATSVPVPIAMPKPASARIFVQV
jgi:hypothetical protein